MSLSRALNSCRRDVRRRRCAARRRGHAAPDRRPVRPAAGADPDGRRSVTLAGGAGHQVRPVGRTSSWRSGRAKRPGGRGLAAQRSRPGLSTCRFGALVGRRRWRASSWPVTAHVPALMFTVVNMVEIVVAVVLARRFAPGAERDQRQAPADSCGWARPSWRPPLLGALVGAAACASIAAPRCSTRSRPGGSATRWGWW